MNFPIHKEIQQLLDGDITSLNERGYDVQILFRRKYFRFANIGGD